VSAPLLAEQGCGADTQISVSGSSFERLHFLAPDPEQFGPKNHKKHCIICATRLPHKLSLWNRNPSFMLWLHHRGSGSDTCHPKLLWLHLRSPVAEAGYETC